MTLVRFIVPCVPVPQPRQRHRIVKPKDRFDDEDNDPCESCFVMNYTPKTDDVQEFKRLLRKSASDAYDGAPLDGPIRLDLVIVMPRPKAKMWKRKPMPREWYGGKTDRDNVLKAVQDALEKILWRNDSRVVAGDTLIVIAAGDEQPHVELVIGQLAPEVGVPDGRKTDPWWYHRKGHDIDDDEDHERCIGLCEKHARESGYYDMRRLSGEVETLPPVTCEECAR